MSGGGGGEVEEEGGGGNVFGEESTEPVALNLTALMDILSNLLFFLLAAFGATIVMGINASVPVSSSKSDVADMKQSVTVGVSLSKEGYSVSALGSAQKQEDLDRWAKRIPPKNGEPDYDALATHLLAIKQQYPKSDTMILTPEFGMNYETMVRTMDAARETEVKVSGVVRTIPVFPTVVVSTVIK
jgi:biopolymer transport protein ExbD